MVNLGTKCEHSGTSSSRVVLIWVLLTNDDRRRQATEYFFGRRQASTGIISMSSKANLDVVWVYGSHAVFTLKCSASMSVIRSRSIPRTRVVVTNWNRNESTDPKFNRHPNEAQVDAHFISWHCNKVRTGSYSDRIKVGLS